MNIFTAPRLVVGALYRQLGEMMKLLWGPNLHMNTVHVRDVARAMWHVTTKPETIGETYNLVDDGDSTQGSISAIVSELFNINHDYWGTALSTLAKVRKTLIGLILKYETIRNSFQILSKKYIINV